MREPLLYLSYLLGTAIAIVLTLFAVAFFIEFLPGISFTTLFFSFVIFLTSLFLLLGSYVMFLDSNLFWPRVNASFVGLTGLVLLLTSFEVFFESF